MMCEGLGWKKNSILTLNPNYSFHPAISPEATEVYVGNIPIFLSLSLFLMRRCDRK